MAALWHIRNYQPLQPRFATVHYPLVETKTFSRTGCCNCPRSLSLSPSKQSQKTAFSLLVKNWNASIRGFLPVGLRTILPFYNLAIKLIITKACVQISNALVHRCTQIHSVSLFWYINLYWYIDTLWYLYSSTSPLNNVVAFLITKIKTSIWFFCMKKNSQMKDKRLKPKKHILSESLFLCHKMMAIL